MSPEEGDGVDGQPRPAGESVPMPRGDQHSSASERALIRASVLAKDPLASPARVRLVMFLRRCGHNFRAEERERIQTRLGRDS